SSARTWSSWMAGCWRAPKPGSTPSRIWCGAGEQVESGAMRWLSGPEHELSAFYPHLAYRIRKLEQVALFEEPAFDPAVPDRQRYSQNAAPEVRRIKGRISVPRSQVTADGDVEVHTGHLRQELAAGDVVIKANEKLPEADPIGFPGKESAYLVRREAHLR